MSHVSKEVAEKLKKLGMNEFTSTYYIVGGNSENLQYSTGEAHYNAPMSQTLSTPDFLTASDWLFQNHSLEIEFGVYKTKVFSHVTAEWLGNFGEADGDHRNAALLHACDIAGK